MGESQLSDQDVIDYIELHSKNIAFIKEIRLRTNKIVKQYNDIHRESANIKRFVPDEAKDVASYLWEQVRQRYTWLKEPDLEDWSNTITKIHRIDGFDWDVIYAVAKWSQNDSFWRQQVRSGNNLRKHFDKMLINIKEKGVAMPKVHVV